MTIIRPFFGPPKVVSTMSAVRLARHQIPILTPPTLGPVGPLETAATYFFYSSERDQTNLSLNSIIPGYPEYCNIKNLVY